MNEIEKAIEEIARRVVREELERADSTRSAEAATADEAQQIRDALRVIKAKEFIKVPEAALLLGCSASHVRGLLRKAETRKATDPIPFRDLDGLITFHVAELEEWAKRRKARRTST
jgi:hypothetical protein